VAELLPFIRPKKIAHFIRVGYCNHTRLENLVAADRLDVDRAVLEVGLLPRHEALSASLRQRGVEVVLDTNMAELAGVGRYGSLKKRVPWAHPDRPWAALDFGQRRRTEVAIQIAEYAVKHQVAAILAPCHLLDSADDDWFAVDRAMCIALRAQLDRRGGGHIGIDYPLIQPYALFRDADQQASVVEKLRGLPFDNLWTRVDGFGSDKTATGVQRYLNAVRQLHGIDRPVIADCVGGLVGVGLVAFGGTGGLAHGVAEKERFNARSWRIPPPKGKRGGGSATRVYLEHIDLLLKVDQVKAIFSVRGTKRRLGCRDMSCCRRGIDDMLRRPDEHFLIQRQRQLESLSAQPEHRRPDHFLKQQLDDVVREARRVSRLVSDAAVLEPELAKKLGEHERRVDDIERMLENDRQKHPGASRSLEPVRRAVFRGSASEGR